MTSIDIFFQREGSREIGHLTLQPSETFATLKKRLVELHGIPADATIFLEDGETPLEDDAAVGAHAGKAGLKVHIHRCRQIHVVVTFNSSRVEREFGPGATISRVKHWAAIDAFHLDKADAGELALQLNGTHDRPPPNTHLGALATHPACKLAFDLVPTDRVNGALEQS
jgi:hypothetical protein